MARLTVLDAHRAACYPDAFKIDPVSGGIKLSLAPGVFGGWICLSNILANAHAQAIDSGGRLEVSGSRFLRAVSRTILKSVGAVRVSGASDSGTDVYRTSRPGRLA